MTCDLWLVTYNLALLRSKWINLTKIIVIIVTVFVYLIRNYQLLSVTL